MYEIPLNIREAIYTYRPVDTEGLRLYPITVREYELLQNARPAIDFLQRSLPVRYLSVPLLSAYYAMDVESFENDEPSNGLFPRALLFLVLALRYKPEDTVEERIRSFASRILVSSEDHTVLTGIVFDMDGEEYKITPIQFQRLRPILAEQNGIILESDDANPELVEAERDIAEMNGPELDHNIYSLISSVATFSGVDEAEIYDWPVLKLYRRKEAYERALYFLVYGFASANGAQFKGGNPVPSPFYNRIDHDSSSLVDIGSVTGGKQVTVSEGGLPPDLNPPQTNS